MKISKYFLKFVVVFFCMNESLADPPKISENMKKMKAVKDRILNGYDKTIRPTEEGSNTTEIYTAFWPRQILEADEERSLLIMDSYIFLSWKDPRLVWDKLTEYDGDLPLSPDLLWTPDLTVFNSHSVQVNPMQRVPTLVLASGHIYWLPPVFTQTSCPGLNEAIYPDEVVTCAVKFGSWTHDGWEIDFSHEEHLYMDEFLNINPRWELIVSDTKLVRNVTYYEGYDAPLLSLDAVFPLKRRIPPEIDATRAPCICIIILTVTIFWLPTNSSTKMFIGGFLFLALTIFLVYVAWSTKIPVLFAVSFLQSTMYMVVIMLLLQVLVIFNICNTRGPVRPPPASMQLVTRFFVRVKSSFSSNIDRNQLKKNSPDA